MPRYQPPGVYTEETPVLPPAVSPLATACPVFVGYTERARDAQDEDLTGKLVRVDTLQAYEARFGGPQVQPVAVSVEHRTDADGNSLGIEVDWADRAPAPPAHSLHHGLQMYFANGGGECGVYSLGRYGAAAREDFIAAFTALQPAEGPTLLAFADAVALEDADYGEVADAALACCRARGHCFALIDVPRAVPGQVDGVGAVDRHFRDHLGRTQPPGLGRHGAAYYPYLATTLPIAWREEAVTLAAFHVSAADGRGGVTRAPVPGAAGRALDDAVLDLRQRAPQVYEAIVRFLDAACVVMPPSAAMAGVYCQVDRQRGVWKAPANVSLSGVRAPAVQVNDREQDDFNVDVIAGKSVNVIRAFPGKGTLVWGARTLMGNDNEWRYVSVRRLADFVEASVASALGALAAQPNAAATWLQVRAMVESFLRNLWRNGALAGVKPEHAFFVNVGEGQTMTAADVAAGRMIVEMGLAAVRPAEFIVLRQTHRLSPP